MPQDYVQFDMDWDPVSFLSEYQSIILPEFRKLERLGATSSTLATLQSMAAAQLENPAFFHDIHFGFNVIALLTSLALLILGLHRCAIITRERRRRRQEQRMDDAVRTALSLSKMNTEEACPHYVGTPMSGQYSHGSSLVMHNQLYPKANAP